MKITPEILIPTTAKSKRLSIVGLVGAALAVFWAGLAWAGIDAPDVFVSSLGTLAAMLAGALDRE